MNMTAPRKWIKRYIVTGYGYNRYHYICRNCGEWFDRDYMLMTSHGSIFNFCPNCGADMRGAEVKNDHGVDL